MEDRESAVSLLFLLAELFLLPDLLADPFILTLGELVAHLVHHILQMPLQRLVLQSLAQCVVPTLVDPER